MYDFFGTNEIINSLSKFFMIMFDLNLQEKYKQKRNNGKTYMNQWAPLYYNGPS